VPPKLLYEQSPSDSIKSTQFNALSTSHLLTKVFGLMLRSVIHSASCTDFTLPSAHCNRISKLLLSIIANKHIAFVEMYIKL